MLLRRADDQQRIRNLQFKVPEGLLGMISEGAAVRRTAGGAGDVPGGIADRAYGRRGGSGSVSAGRAAAGQAAGADLPDRGLRRRAVRPFDRGAVGSRPVHAGNTGRSREDRSGSAYCAVDGHDRSVPDDHRRGAGRPADDRRCDRSSGIHVQPDRLRTDVLRWDGVRAPKARAPRSRATSRLGRARH